MFYKVFLELCNKKGISPSAAAEEMGYKRSVVTRWSKGAIPRDATIARIAEYFGVQADMFAEKEKLTTRSSSEQLFLDDFNSLNVSDQRTILDHIKFLRAQELQGGEPPKAD